MAMVLVAKPLMTLCPADLHNYASRRGSFITGIILHATQGWRAGTVQKFQDPHAQASCHFLVCKDGELIQFVPEDYAAWHTGNGDFNKHTIGIEIEALVQKEETKNCTACACLKFDHGCCPHGRAQHKVERFWLNPPDGFTEKQYKSLLALCQYLVAAYKIDPKHVGRDEPRIVGFRAHSDVPNPHHSDQWGGINHHEDPGPHFPWWEQLMKELQPPA